MVAEPEASLSRPAAESAEAITAWDAAAVTGRRVYWLGPRRRQLLADNPSARPEVSGSPNRPPCDSPLVCSRQAQQGEKRPPLKWVHEENAK